MESKYQINSLASLYQVLRLTARLFPERPALRDDTGTTSYLELLGEVEALAAGLAGDGIGHSDRIALIAPKDRQLVRLMLACNMLGAVFVPINPQLKSAQVGHILRDCGPVAVITTTHRARTLKESAFPAGLRVLTSDALPRAYCEPDWARACGRRSVDGDPAAILYTSGSTGLAKGVVLSQRNLVAGALSVSDYLEISPQDVVLGVLPINFDAGLSQMTTALVAGACYVPYEFLTAVQLRKMVARHEPTVVTAVPPLWHLIADEDWTLREGDSFRVIANTGGHMAPQLLARLRERFPRATPILMYGLTESFRSTWLDPAELEERPGSMGRAVPNAEIMVARPDGSECDVGEPGELVHRGGFVTLGYLGREDQNQLRFRPWPRGFPGQARGETAVWSGDTVVRDAEGFLHFVGRTDEMIKVSGHRISPTEVESALLACEGIAEAAVFGVADERLGQAIVACLVADPEHNDAELLSRCRRVMPVHMLPAHIVRLRALPRNNNGKVDRPAIKQCWLEQQERARGLDGEPVAREVYR